MLLELFNVSSIYLYANLITKTYVLCLHHILCKTLGFEVVDLLELGFCSESGPLGR